MTAERRAILIGAGPTASTVLLFTIMASIVDPPHGRVDVIAGLVILVGLATAIFCPFVAFFLYREGDSSTGRRWKRGFPVLLISYAIIAVSLLLLAVAAFASSAPRF